MARPGLRKVHRYSDEFKATAVQLSSLPAVLIQDVADALDIHPFMLSRWRKEYREGKSGAMKTVPLDEGTAAELKRLKQLARDHALLQQEPQLLKKAIRFSSERRTRSSRSLTASRERTPCP